MIEGWEKVIQICEYDYTGMMMDSKGWNCIGYGIDNSISKSYRES